MTCARGTYACSQCALAHSPSHVFERSVTCSLSLCARFLLWVPVFQMRPRANAREHATFCICSHQFHLLFASASASPREIIRSAQRHEMGCRPATLIRLQALQRVRSGGCKDSLVRGRTDIIWLYRRPACGTQCVLRLIAPWWLQFEQPSRSEQQKRTQ